MSLDTSATSMATSSESLQETAELAAPSSSSAGSKRCAFRWMAPKSAAVRRKLLRPSFTFNETSIAIPAMGMTKHTTNTNTQA